MTTEPAIEIRKAVAEDAAAITALLYAAFAEYKPLYTEKSFAATTPPEQEIADRINRNAVWVAMYDNTIAGTVSIFPRYEELYIRSMAVSPWERGKGVARILMDHVHAIAFSEGCSSITLNTTPFLLPAIRLYENSGFKQEGVGHLYGTPLIKMNKNLKTIAKHKLEKNDHAK